jgi:hypothetical protein
LSEIRLCDHRVVATSPEAGADLYRNLRLLKIIALLALLVLVLGFLLCVVGGFMRAGFVLVGLGILGVVTVVIVHGPLRKKIVALREPGTANVLTFNPGGADSESGTQLLTSELQIRLDSGHTVRGPFWAMIGPLDAARFHVGASLRCLVNPARPNVVQVFPFAAPGDALPAGRDVLFTSTKFSFPRN